MALIMILIPYFLIGLFFAAMVYSIMGEDAKEAKDIAIITFLVWPVDLMLVAIYLPCLLIVKLGNFLGENIKKLID